MLSNIGKILEKVVNKQLVKYLDGGNLIPPNQYGFRKGVSTQDALLAITDKIYNSLDKGKKVIVIFLDLARAFDSVPHLDLIYSLKRLGIDGTVLHWFENYLSDRKHSCRINKSLSSPLSSSFSIPQGTILGPKLFSAYLAELCLIELDGGKLVSYADDTALVFEGNTWEIVHNQATLGLDRVRDWMREQTLTINLNKSKYMTFSLSSRGQPARAASEIVTHSSVCPRSPGCACVRLERVEEIKYLGVTIDNQVKWKTHIKLISSKLKRVVPIILTLRNFCTIKILKLVYFALVQSILQYCVVGWGGAFSSNLLPLKSVQNLILKCMCRKGRLDSPSPLFQELSIMSFETIYKYNCLLAIKKSASSINMVVSNRLGRYIRAEKEKTSSGQRYWRYLGAKYFNNLPLTVRDYWDHDYPKYKNLIKKYHAKSPA